MERGQWQELCGRIGAIWPGKKLPAATVDAWYAQFGSWAEYEQVGLVIATLGATKKTAPALSELREAYAQRGGQPKPLKPDEEETPYDRERWDTAAKRWIRINRCMHDQRISGVFMALFQQDADPEDTRIAVLAEIDALGVEEKDAPPARDVAGFTAIGDVLPSAVPS